MLKRQLNIALSNVCFSQEEYHVLGYCASVLVVEVAKLFPEAFYELQVREACLLFCLPAQRFLLCFPALYVALHEVPVPRAVMQQEVFWLPALFVNSVYDCACGAFLHGVVFSVAAF